MTYVDTPTQKRLREYFKLLTIWGAILLVTLIVGEAYWVSRKRADIVSEAHSYLMPLPESINLDFLLEKANKVEEENPTLSAWFSLIDTRKLGKGASPEEVKY